MHRAQPRTQADIHNYRKSWSGIPGDRVGVLFKLGEEHVGTTRPEWFRLRVR
jgi:hypothetical protein